MHVAYYVAMEIMVVVEIVQCTHKVCVDVHTIKDMPSDLTY